MHDYGYAEKNQKAKLTDLYLWRRIFTYIRPRLVLLLFAIVIAFVITASSLALPRLVQMAIDNSITAEHLETAERFTRLTRDASIYGVLVVLIFVLSFTQVMLLQRLGQDIMHSLRQRLFGHLLSLEHSFFNATPSGRLVTRLTNDINNMNEMFTSVIVTIFNDLLSLVGILVILFFMNSQLATIMAFFLPLALVMTLIFSRLARESFRKIRAQLTKINSYLAEILTKIETLQVFNQEKRSQRIFETLTEEYQRRTLHQIKLFGAFMPLSELLSSIAIAIILWYGGGHVLQEHLTLGELVAFLTYMRLFFRPLRELSQKYSIVQSAMASSERIFELLDREKEILEAPTAIFLKNPAGKVEFQKVSFSYQPEEPILKEIDLVIPAGKTVAIVGATGSGKSTLVNLLLRFYDPDQGKITLDGVDIRELSLHQLRTCIGVILQDIFILQESLLANIVLDGTTTRKEVEQMLEGTNMRGFVDKLPQGLDTRIGDGGIALSTGEKQLLSFARVLCKKPSVLVLDEATAAIDTESENLLEKVIARSFTGRSSLVIAHRLSTIRRADHILLMSNGKIVEQGSHSSLMAAGKEYAKMVKMDLQKEK